MAKEVRLIDANALMDAFCEACSTNKRYRRTNEQCRNYRDSYGNGCFKMRLVENAPTVDTVCVRHGNWVYYSTTMQECSNCHRHTARHKFKYCPHCGAVMGDKHYEA